MLICHKIQPTNQFRVSSSLIGFPIHTILCYIWAKSLIDGRETFREISALFPEHLLHSCTSRPPRTQSVFMGMTLNCNCWWEFLMIFRKFVKELVILFHQTAAAPWGYVTSIIKNEFHWSYFPLPTLIATGPFVAALDGKRIWNLLPPARSQERRTHVLS